MLARRRAIASITLWVELLVVGVTLAEALMLRAFKVLLLIVRVVVVVVVVAVVTTGLEVTVVVVTMRGATAGVGMVVG